MVKIDFTDSTFLYRLEHSGKKQMLPKACGLHLGYQNIIDMTAGLGEDSFVLAHLGCTLTLIERNKTVFNALSIALDIAKKTPETYEAANRITLLHGNSIEILPTLEDSDVIFCDPMFPERQKSALVKQAMRDLKNTVGDDPDSDILLAAALTHNTKRVVVKRPKLAGFLNKQEPNFQVKGKSGRFDVYLTPS